MKFLLSFFTLIFFTFSSQSQSIIRLKEYKASNEIIYKIGDTIKLGRGSNPNGKFVYVTMSGWALSSDPDKNMLSAVNSGLEVRIKKIKKYNTRNLKAVHFTVGGGNITNYNLDIESAIQTCEIEDCTKEENSNVVIQQKETRLDKLKKLKELLDMEAITQEEFELEKKKILEQ